MASLAEIRAKLKEQETRSSGASHDNSVYPFWNLKEGGEATIRFLPDGDPNNTFFWVERAMIKLPFAGVKGQTDSKQVIVNVPCMEMYGETCPVLSEVRGWFKDPSLEDMGRKYWKKRSYIFQGLVVEDGLKESDTPENPIRRHIIGPQLFQLIKSALLDPEMDDLPTDTVNGVDFKIVKTSKGGYADYSTSKWSRRSRPLSDAEQAIVEQFGLFNLKDFLPKKPTDAEVKIIKEMFEASVDGEPYDMERWGQYFKPAGIGAPTSESAVASTAPAAPRVEQVRAPQPEPTASVAPWESEKAEDAELQEEVSQPASKPAPTSGGRAEDILAMIRSRSKQ
jgi:hypothetical protein